jgi:hypothetical protein
MDLESTLIRAESLFRRFQRTVETIDKKDNFPTPPRARQRKSIAEPPTSSGPSAAKQAQPEASSSGTDKGKQVAAEQKQNEERVISTELRSLLSKKVEKLDKAGVKEHGGGTGS